MAPGQRGEVKMFISVVFDVKLIGEEFCLSPIRLLQSLHNYPALPKPALFGNTPKWDKVAEW